MNVIDIIEAGMRDAIRAGVEFCQSKGCVSVLLNIIFWGHRDVDVDVIRGVEGASGTCGLTGAAAEREMER